MATQEIFSQLLWNDGEGITHTDLNGQQAYMRAALWDKLVQSLIGNVYTTGGTSSPTHQNVSLNGLRGLDAPTHMAYCLNGGSAFPYRGSAANKIKISAGVLMQKTAASDGNSPKLLAYHFAGTEEVTISAGDATYDRIDLIQMKLEEIDGSLQSVDFKDATTGAITTTSKNKKKFIQCTLSVKQGALGAGLGSPARYPDPDAGYCAVAAVYVGPGYVVGTNIIHGIDTSGANAVLHDLRMPVNVKAYKSNVQDMQLNGVWTVGSNKRTLSSSSTTVIGIKSPVIAGVGRLVGLEWHKVSGPNAGQSYLTRIASDGSTGTGCNLLCSPFDATSDAEVNASSNPIIPFHHIERVNVAAQGGTGGLLPSTTNKICTPLWSNGLRCAYSEDSGPSDLDFNFCQAVASAGVYWGFTWHYAVGI